MVWDTSTKVDPSLQHHAPPKKGEEPVAQGEYTDHFHEDKYDKVDKSLASGMPLKQVAGITKEHFHPPHKPKPAASATPEQIKADMDRPPKWTDNVLANPLIPFGLAATTWAVFSGMISMLGPDRRKSNIMMRTRVGAQAFTVFCMAFGTVMAGGQFMFKKDKTKES